MKRNKHILPASMMLFCSGLTMATLASEAYANDAVQAQLHKYERDDGVIKGENKAGKLHHANIQPWGKILN